MYSEERHRSPIRAQVYAGSWPAGCAHKDSPRLRPANALCDQARLPSRIAAHLFRPEHGTRVHATQRSTLLYRRRRMRPFLSFGSAARGPGCNGALHRRDWDWRVSREIALRK